MERGSALSLRGVGSDKNCDQSKPADSLCRNIETGTEDGVGDEEGGTGKMKERWGLPWWSCC